MLTILSPHSAFRATVCDHDDGVWVAVRRAATTGVDYDVQVSAGLVDATFHSVCDRVTDLLAELEEGAPS